MVRPHAITATDGYLALVLDQMEATNALLAEIRDRLPAPQRPDPQQEPNADGRSVRVDITEPEKGPDPAPPPPDKPASDRPLPKRQPVKKTPAKVAKAATKADGPAPRATRKRI